MNNRIQRGNVAELMVAAEASKRNFVVSLPISHNSHYDLILDKGKLIKVQVKRAYPLQYHDKKMLCVEGRLISGGKKNSYEKGSYDYLFACDVDKGDIWIIPFVYASKFKAQIYLETSKTIQYKNQWSLVGVG